MNNWLTWSLLCSVLLPALALGSALLFSGVRLSRRAFGILYLLLWLALLAAAGSFGLYTRAIKLEEAGLGGYLIFGLYWLIGLTVLNAGLTWWLLRRLGTCSRWRAACVAALVALTIAAGTVAAFYFLAQTNLQIGM